MAILLIVIAGALAAYLITQRNKLPATSSYTKKPDGDWTSFDVTPGRPSIQGSAILPAIGGGTALILIGEYAPLGGLGTAFMWFGFFGLLFGVWITFRDARPKSHGKPTQFRVSAKAIEVDGQQYSTEDIHEVKVKNGIDTDVTYAVTDNRSAVNAAARLQDAKRASNTAYSLNVEEGGRSHVLAAGMTDTTVNGLLHDVVKALGWEMSR
jgi:hypothetical protein